MGTRSATPSAGRRLAAIVAILLVLGVIVASLAIGTDEPLRVLAGLVLIVVFLAAVWIALTRAGRAGPGRDRRGRRRRRPGRQRRQRRRVARRVDGRRVLALIGAVALAKYALGTTVGSLKAAEVEGTPVPAAKRGVLFMNLKSGGGKAERFHLVDECNRRGIEPIVLQPGEDWLQLVRDVAASGVDVLGMAGGDGSQALVGSVAAELGLPMVVVPAGTRNHLALDLGLDRDDVVGALDAYGDAVERTTRPRRRERARVRQQRVARPLRGDRALARVPRREGGHDPRDAAAGARARTPSRSTCASPAPTARSTRART